MYDVLKKRIRLFVRLLSIVIIGLIAAVNFIGYSSALEPYKEYILVNNISLVRASYTLLLHYGIPLFLVMSFIGVALSYFFCGKFTLKSTLQYVLVFNLIPYFAFGMKLYDLTNKNPLFIKLAFGVLWAYLILAIPGYIFTRLNDEEISHIRQAIKMRFSKSIGKGN